MIFFFIWTRFLFLFVARNFFLFIFFFFSAVWLLMEKLIIIKSLLRFHFWTRSLCVCQPIFSWVWGALRLMMMGRAIVLHKHNSPAIVMFCFYLIFCCCYCNIVLAHCSYCTFFAFQFFFFIFGAVDAFFYRYYHPIQSTSQKKITNFNVFWPTHWSCQLHLFFYFSVESKWECAAGGGDVRFGCRSLYYLEHSTLKPELKLFKSTT